MTKKRSHIVSVIFLSTSVFALAVILSGAPLRVHLVDAVSLILAFTIPTAYISRKEDIKTNRVQIISFWFLGTIVWFLLSSVVVAKAELSISRLATLLVVSFIGLSLFVATHLILIKAAGRLGKTPHLAQQNSKDVGL
jgi:FtsH-binding integral membrane protein